MAIDKSVDSTKLDACLNAEADAIRAKTGDSADIAFDYANDKGFADAIAAIPSGSSILEITTPQIINLAKAVFPENFTELNLNVTAIFANSLANMLGYSQFAKINLNMAGTYNGSVSGVFRESANLEEVHITNAQFTYGADYIFYNCSKLRTVTGLNCTSSGNAAWSNAFTSCSALENIEFIQNSIYNSIRLSYSPLLTIASLVSIANGLHTYSSGTWTLQLASQSKTKLSTILGTVNDGVFAESAGGTVTLQNFVTNTKGWTIA